RPQDVVAARQPHAQDTLYKDAAAALKELVERTPSEPSRPPSGERYELTVQLTLKPPDLTRIYWGRDGRITERRLPWQARANPTGDDLFDTLFGSPETCEHVLKSLFGAAAEPARPIRHAVRVRIQTDAPILADLPWATMTWKSNALRDSGWTFELMGGGPLTARPTFDDMAFTLRRDTLSSIRYSEALNFNPSSGTIQRTARHGILEQKSSDLQVSG
ncbi:MAG: hypothetical protein V3U27_21195, partial [Candidatus Tectomicrobia bacterium]